MDPLHLDTAAGNWLAAGCVKEADAVTGVVVHARGFAFSSNRQPLPWQKNRCKSSQVKSSQGKVKGHYMSDKVIYTRRTAVNSCHAAYPTTLYQALTC